MLVVETNTGKETTMGLYINPPDMTKEEWLAKYAEEATPTDLALTTYPLGDKVPVVLVDNGWFTAAGVMYSVRELQEFLDPFDSRPKKCFLASKEELLKLPDFENVKL